MLSGRSVQVDARPRGRPRGTYRCWNPNHRPQGCGRSIRSCLIDEPVVDLIIDALSSAEFRARLESAARGEQDTGDLEELVGEVRALDASLQDWKDAVGVKVGPDAYAQAEFNIQRRKQEIQLQLEQYRDTRAGLLASLPTEKEQLTEAWDKWDDDERRAVLKACLKRVEVESPGQGRRLDPLKHLNPVWRV